MKQVMGGWVTWLSVAGFAILGVVDVAMGNIPMAMTKFTAALSALGLGRKIEKAKE